MQNAAEGLARFIIGLLVAVLLGLIILAFN